MALIRFKPQRNDWVALLAGALVPFGFAPFAFYPILLVSLMLIFDLWRMASPKQSLRFGLIFGVGMFGVGISWIYVAIHEFGHTPLVVAALLTLFAVLFLSLFPAVVGYLIALFRDYARLKPDSVWLLIGIMPATWIIFEWIRGWILTGFPWLNLGNSLIDSPLAGWAPVIGVYGLGWLFVLSASSLLMLRYHQRYAWFALLSVFWIAGGILSNYEWTAPTDKRLSVALVQGNVPQATKWNPETIQLRLDRYAQLSIPLFKKHQLVVWPENSITVFYDQVKERLFAPLNQYAKAAGSSLLVGIPIRKVGGGYYTSMINPLDDTQRYHKRHLVPFGEYLPSEWLRGLINLFNLPMSQFSAGDADQGPITIGGVRAAVSICYEDIFPQELMTQLPEATILINGSNNGWYGDSFAPHQHLQIARMRSLEFGRPTLRATTNGISAIIDNKGKIKQRSEQFVSAVVEGEVTPRTGRTPYLIYGNYLSITLVLISLLLSISISRVRQKRSTHDDGNSSSPL